MGRFIFNPFTQNFTVIPNPPKEGFYQFAARNGKLEWVEREDPQAKTLNLSFTSDAVPFVSSVGILPRVVFYRGDGDYAGSQSQGGVYNHEFLLNSAVSNEAFFVVGVYLAPDQGSVGVLNGNGDISLPVVAIDVSPVADSSGANVAFLYAMKFTTDAAVSMRFFDL
jgi:hypothetical protein